jgi:hypothetical protein
MLVVTGTRVRSVGKTKADDAPQGLQTVFSVDLLAFFVGPASLEMGTS